MSDEQDDTGTDEGNDSGIDERGGDSGLDERGDSETTVRVRGIYATALTHRLREGDHEVVQASPPIRDRFADAFRSAPAAASIETTRDREGVGVSGSPEAVRSVAAALEGIGIDAFRWRDGTPRGAVFDGRVVEAAGGGGAVVDLGDERGYLPYDAVDGYVDEGDRYRLQVHDQAPPWDDDRPLVRPTLEVESGLLWLSRDSEGISADAGGDRATELVGMTDLLSTDLPDGWGLRWRRPATDADLESMDAALERAAERATELEDALAEAGDPGEPGRLATPEATEWVWFGRESRLALDEHRRAVETTMVGHHRTKAAHESASAAVDFAEAVCDDAGDGEFPFGAVTRQFGPEAGDRLELGHGKPDGRYISLGTGEVADWDPDGSITLEREMRGNGTYDALGTTKEAGDVAVTKLKEGRWWYPTTYRGEDGTVRGTYVNVCTPVELFPDVARYVDLYVDVIRYPDGTVETVDESELEAAADDGLVAPELAEKARSVASAVERALS